MQKNVYLAVEATGLDTDTNRVVEIVALEALGSQLTGSQFHVLLNPEHQVEEIAGLVTGYDQTQLEGLPTFSEMTQTFLNFVKGANLIVFNARWGFDLIEAELARLDRPPLSQHVRRLKDVKAMTEKLELNVRLSLDKLAFLFDCREPVQACSSTWRECYMLSQVFPRLEINSDDTAINIGQLETMVPVHDGPYGTQYIEIIAIPEPWRSQFVRWFCAGKLNGDERINRCHWQHWAEWLSQTLAQCPELAPSQFEELPSVQSDVRAVMRQGYQRAQLHREGKFVRYPKDLEREMHYQATLATYGVQEKPLYEAYIRGFRRGLTAPSAITP